MSKSSRMFLDQQEKLDELQGMGYQAGFDNGYEKGILDFMEECKKGETAFIDGVITCDYKTIYNRLKLKK